jgi:hypothetical protein
MTDAPLATVSQLGAYLQQNFSSTDPSALLVLQIASAIVRDHLNQKLTLTPGDVVTLNPVYNQLVLLPELPVVVVSQLETYNSDTNPGVWSVINPLYYTVSTLTGVVAAKPFTGVVWPSDPGSWRVTYDHGFTAIPDALMAVCVGVAARIYATEDGIDLERIGGYQVKYQSDVDGFSPLQIKALARYVVPRVA